MFSYSPLRLYIEYFSTRSSKFRCVEEILLNNPIIVDAANTKFLKKNKRIFRGQNLTIKYIGSKFNLPNGINFKIYPGELIAIVGPVGCGKTNLAKSLGRTIEIPMDNYFYDIDVKILN